MARVIGSVAAACAALAIGVLVLTAAMPSSPAGPAGEPAAAPAEEAITPVPAPQALDPRRVALGERLFRDTRLSRDGARSCASCHDLDSNGAGAASAGGFDVPTVFNAALSFRLGWRGRYRTLEEQATASLDNPKVMGGALDAALVRLATDPDMVGAFRAAYGAGPSRERLIDAIASFERSLLTPDSRFDRYLKGDAEVLDAPAKEGLRLFEALGCATCHQGVNVGGNLFQRQGVFRTLASPEPEILRVPSLRNIGATAPYFHDGSAPTLDDAVRRMAEAQLNVRLEDHEAAAIVAFLESLTGRYGDKPVQPRVPR